MSFAKYAQFYKDNGFFAGSKIKATITDNSFIGQEMVLSKDNTVLQTRIIPVSGVAEFFTDASGELTLSVDNGDSTISGTIEIGAYGTYEVTVSGSGSSGNARQAYANDVEMNSDTVTTSIAYTGDVSSISAVNSDPSLVSLLINGGEITLRDAGNDKSGKCSITATVAASDKYSSADVTFYVNKLTGTYGSWEDASDEKIASMIAKADAGEINLADFWNIGDVRRVHLNAIEAGTSVAAQPEQDIDLVIMHNTTGSSFYTLSETLESGKANPNFLIGTKDCLARLSAMAFFQKTITAKYSSYSYSNKSYYPIDGTESAELYTMLNGKFIEALPIYIQNALKTINRRYISAGSNQNIDVGSDILTYMGWGNIKHKVSLLNLRELGFTSSITGDSTRRPPAGKGIYRSTGSFRYYTASSLANLINSQINNCGNVIEYYQSSENRIKEQSGTPIDYLINDAFMSVSREEGTTSSCNTNLSMAFYIDENGELQTNNLDDEATRVKLRGISPIMFI